MNPLHQLQQKIEELDLWERDFKPLRNEYIKVAGSIDTNIYFVKEGSLRIFVVDKEEELTIRFAYKYNFVAALDSYISQQPSDLYIQALKKSQLKVIGKKKFMDFIFSNKENLKLWHVILEQLVFQQMERERDLLTSSPSERYQRVLQTSPQLFQEIPNRYIASYLRMTPETLSRLKKS
ncbi:cyclic nucleotide-binding domain-containing protein [Salegentibacter sp. F188]|uniref:Cyclic nucleotide-binding domain-containing protein n=1 Tax=Autumnicola patrickiae TaxID=3075591 RepID=A0ABU3E202_9FLAO|nr:cyclic nucleotide-binding domain-containing protein [Salegentibacter sp. F188]MDT0690024.1 cyclic nucleotide-binding domain-containing protein [Salegentibacter sp. F188]